MNIIKKIFLVGFLIFILYSIFFSFSEINKFREDDEQAAEVLSYIISKYAKENNKSLVEAYNEKLYMSEELRESPLQNYILKNVDNWKLNKIIYLISQVKLNTNFSYLSIFFSIIISSIIFIKSTVINKNIFFSYLYSILFFVCCLNLPISMNGHVHLGISALILLLISILLTNKVSFINYLFISILIALLIFNQYPPPIILSFLIIVSFFLFKFYEDRKILLKIIMSLVIFTLIVYFFLLFIYKIYFINNYFDNVYSHAYKEGIYKIDFLNFFYNLFLFFKLTFIPISLEKYKTYFTHQHHLVNYSLISPLIFLFSFSFFFYDLKHKKTFIHLFIILYFIFLFLFNIQQRYLYILLPIMIYHSLYIFNRFDTLVINKLNIFIFFSIFINIFLLSNYFFNDRNQYNNFISGKSDVLQDTKNIILQNNLKFTQILSLHNSLNNPSSTFYRLPKDTNINTYNDFINTQLPKGSNIFIFSTSNFFSSAPDDWNNDNDEWINFDFNFPNLIPKLIFNDNKKVFYKLYNLTNNNYCWLPKDSNKININKKNALIYIDNVSVLNSLFEISDSKLIKESKVLLNNNNLRVFMKIEGKFFKIESKAKSFFLKELFVKSSSIKTENIIINSKIKKYRNTINEINFNNILEIIEIKNADNNIYTIYLNVDLNKKIDLPITIKTSYQYSYEKCKN